MTAVIGRAFESLVEDQIDRYVDELLSLYDERVAGSESIVVLPEASYPFHPSTGLVTNPAVAVAAAKSLGRRVEPDRLTVAIAGSSWSPAAQVSVYLGYTDLLADTTVELVHLDEVDARPQPFGDGEGVLSVPSLLEESVVVNVPTLRRSTELGMVAGLGNLALAMTTDPTPDAVLAAADCVDPAVTLLDGTYVFAGAPSKPTFLLASDDRTALDQVGAALLGLDADGVPYLEEPSADVDSLLEGIRLQSVRSEIKRGNMLQGGDGPSGLMVAGYRLYAHLSGDLLPPQFLGDTDG